MTTGKQITLLQHIMVFHLHGGDGSSVVHLQTNNSFGYILNEQCMIISCQLSMLNVFSFSLNMHMSFKTKGLALLYRKQTTYVYELWPFDFIPPFYLQSH
jgi:hypothetical protein